MNSISPGIITVVAGDYNLYWNEGTEQSRHVAKIITNNFDAPTFTNDIALVKLSYPLDFFSSSAIAPLCLPYAFQKFQGEDSVKMRFAPLCSLITIENVVQFSQEMRWLLAGAA